MDIFLNSTLGAAFVGHFVTTIMFGITTMQTWIYFNKKHIDPGWLRSLVLFLWLLDAIHTALLTCAIYNDLIINFGNIIADVGIYWSIPALVIVTGVSNAIVRGVFAFRLWKLSGNAMIVPLVIGALSLYHIGDSIYFAVKGSGIPSVFAIRKYSWSLYAGFGAEIIADSIITFSQYLILRRFRTGIASTDSAIHILMVYTINTCLITSLCEVACLVTYATLPDMLVYWAFYWVTEKLYINALLANLNARDVLKESLGQPVHRTGSEATPAGIFSTLEFTDNRDRPISRDAASSKHIPFNLMSAA